MAVSVGYAKDFISGAVGKSVPRIIIYANAITYNILKMMGRNNLVLALLSLLSILIMGANLYLVRRLGIFF